MSSTAGPFAGESKADAWLFEHSKFLRKHFSPQGPSDIPSKHELIQDRTSGDAFPDETKIDAALFEHSKFLRKHVKHNRNADVEIKSKSRMLRENLDGKTSNSIKAETSQGSVRGDHSSVAHPDDPIVVAAPFHDGDVANGTNPTGETDAARTSEYRREPSSADPARQTAIDSERTYGDKTSLRSAAAAHAGPGLISSHPTTMESTTTPGERPVPHSLLSNSEHARVYDEVIGEDSETPLPKDDSLAR